MSINSSSLVFPPTWPQDPRGNLKIRSLKVVQGAPNSFELKPGKGVNWVPLPEMDCKGGVVDYRPREEHRSQCFATQVIWHSRVPHCGAKPQAKDGFKLIKQDDHFQDSNIDEAYKYAKKNGYAVIEHFSLSKKNHAEYMQLLLEDVQSIQKEHRLDSLQELDNKHLPGYDGNGLRSFGGLCYGKFAGAMRSNEYVKKIFQHIYQTDQLCCSLDAPAISVKTGSPQGFTHQDMDENHDYEMWQSCFVLASPLPRIGQMVCMKPWLTAEQRSLAKQCIRNGSSMTHDLVRVNKKAVPTFRPAPKPHLYVYDDEHAKRIGDTTYIQRNEAMLPELLPTTYQGFVSDNSQTQTLNRSFSPEPLKVPEVGDTYVRKERVGKPYAWVEPGGWCNSSGGGREPIKCTEYMSKGHRVIIDKVYTRCEGHRMVRFETADGILTNDMCGSGGRKYFAELYDFHKHMEFVEDENDKEAEAPAKRRRIVALLPVLRGTLKHFDESKQRFVDDDDNFDPENDYVIYFKNKDNEICIGQSWNMLYLQDWDGEIVCDMGGYGGGTCLLGDNIQCLSTALQTLYKDFKEFKYDRVFVEEKLWNKKGNEDFVAEAKRVGAAYICIVS